MEHVIKAEEPQREYHFDMKPEQFEEQWDKGFADFVQKPLKTLGDKPTYAVGDIVTISSLLPGKQDILKITIV